LSSQRHEIFSGLGEEPVISPSSVSQVTMSKSGRQILPAGSPIQKILLLTYIAVRITIKGAALGHQHKMTVPDNRQNKPDPLPGWSVHKVHAQIMNLPFLPLQYELGLDKVFPVFPEHGLQYHLLPVYAPPCFPFPVPGKRLQSLWPG
jgi:hypothetical protein